MNRGSRLLGRPGRPAEPRFNEAPIHESGKFKHARRSKHQRYRFNEAPIHESGKSR